MEISLPKKSIINAARNKFQKQGRGVSPKMENTPGVDRDGPRSSAHTKFRCAYRMSGINVVDDILGYLL